MNQGRGRGLFTKPTPLFNKPRDQRSWIAERNVFENPEKKQYRAVLSTTLWHLTSSHYTEIHVVQTIIV